MPPIQVTFVYHTGLSRGFFNNARLSGSWDSHGIYSQRWSEAPMRQIVDEAGCSAFMAIVPLDSSQVGGEFQWGVTLDAAGAPNTWGIVTELPNADSVDSAECHRRFVLGPATQTEHYWFSTARRFGAQKAQSNGGKPGIRFSVWAPYAKAVDVVFAKFNATTDQSGYIENDNSAQIDRTVGNKGAFPLFQSSEGIWSTDTAKSPELADYDKFHQRLYMFRIKNEQGTVTYKTDLWSRSQIGRGAFNPNGKPYAGSYRDLDGTVSCSVVAEPDLVTKDFNDSGWPKHQLISAEEFWKEEFVQGRTPPRRVEDLLIYELHVGSLGFGSTAAGTFSDAMDFVSQLVALGVNAVELLPVLEFDGDIQWGYGTSHFFCLQTSAGGGNQLKHFVRACHQAGIAVILDVVYNHFTDSGGDRAEWGYDSDPVKCPEHNIYYWYEGQSNDYRDWNGGYLDNGSSGWAPRYREENVRQMFTSSAAMLFDEYHIDGIRVDLTGAIHQDNHLHEGQRPVGNANLYGIKLLRELTRTVRMVHPAAFLMAEDHTGWDAMTKPVDQGGVGFDAVWYADFYHHLIGDGNYGANYAKLLKAAGSGSDGALAMDYFARALSASGANKIVYSENHDEAGNGENTERTMVTAVNGAALTTGENRKYAEARCRFCYGMSALSAGTPMFFMGEEIGAAKYFRVKDFNLNKEDLIGERAGNGRFLFRFYQDLHALVRKYLALRSRTIDVPYTHNSNRILAFYRTDGSEHMLIVGSLNNQPFGNGYHLPLDPSRVPSGQWREVFNSDGIAYGGDNRGNAGATLPITSGALDLVIPANGFVVLQKVG